MKPHTWIKDLAGRGHVLHFDIINTLDEFKSIQLILDLKRQKIEFACGRSKTLLGSDHST